MFNTNRTNLDNGNLKASTESTDLGCYQNVNKPQIVMTMLV